MTKQTQEQVAKTLKDSWLFYQACPASHSTENGDDSHEDCMLCKGDEKRYFKIPTADQAEAILNALFKVSIDKLDQQNFSWRIIVGTLIVTYGGSHDGKLRSATFREGKLSLKLNKAIAWCCDNLRAELELAINTINQK